MTLFGRFGLNGAYLRSKDDWFLDFKENKDVGFTIYPGKISTLNTFRLCALGAIDEEDIRAFYVVFKDALKHLNVAVPVQYNE